MEGKFRVSSSPHIRSKETISTIMRDVLIALTPAAAFSVYLYGMNALILMVLSVATAVGTEAAIQKMRNQRVTIKDYSAAVTGLLLAMNIPASAPWWMPIVGSVFAVAIVKQLFGGLGHNFMNPALAARAFLIGSWPVEMTSWVAPGADAVSTATPLGMNLLKSGQIPADLTLLDLLIGTIGGSLGETSALLLLAGGLYLVYRGVISIRIPAMYIGTVFVLTLVLSGFNVMVSLYSLFAGGLILGAFFMATDYSSSPVTAKGQLIFAFGAGLITTIIRFYGGYPEGVSYAIILMNVATPIIEKYTAPRVFGEAKA